MTDFVRLKHLTLTEVVTRIKVDDPRSTPLTSLLVSSFSTFRSEEPWRIWYIPVDSESVYSMIQNAFTGIDSAWAWDAQPAPPGFRFLWIIWAIWILWLLATRPVKDRRFHGLLIAAWLPLAFIHSLAAAALMVVGQGISAILGMSILAGGRKHHFDKREIRGLLANLAPFLVSMFFLLFLDTWLWFPVAVAVLTLVVLTINRESISGVLETGKMHQKPTFRLILDDTLRIKGARLGLWSILPLLLMMIIVVSIPFRGGDQSAYHLVFNTDPFKQSATSDYANMLRSHTIYQEALTWGRLGDARWMADSYTRPFRFEVLNNRIVRGDVDKDTRTDGFNISSEHDRELKRLLDHTKGGTPYVVKSTDLPRNSTAELDSQGVVFYIMALVPFCVLGLQKIGRSRRRIITSYLNRQVA
ncbi:MAG: hypothetical protein RBT68_03620 [Spirochaetia bacterium]|nr:hypothetical protein [Spirochaetia bacterium]